MRQIISRPYDSHVHFSLTGEYALSYCFQDQSDFHYLNDLILNQFLMRGHFFIGRQLCKNNFESFLIQHKQTALSFLDSVSRDIAIYLISKDGHTAFLNSKALDYFSEEKKILLDKELVELGIARENIHFELYRLLPAFSDSQIESIVQQSRTIFHQAGFTHLRDMTMDLLTWQYIAKNPQDLFIESYYYLSSLHDLKKSLEVLATMKSTANQYLKPRGLKIFIDGSLHSQSALLSIECDCQKNGKKALWTGEDYQNVLRSAWQNGYELAVHSIGDQAVDLIVDWTRQVSAEGVSGRLCIEHAEFVRPETIHKMKALHVEVYMQPSHLQLDMGWMDRNAKSRDYAFVYEKLLSAGVPVYFGSDSPFALSGWQQTKKGIDLAVEKKLFKVNKAKPIESHWNAVYERHAHPNKLSPESQVILNNFDIQELYFQNKRLV